MDIGLIGIGAVIGVLVVAWVRIRQLEFDVESHKLETEIVVGWYRERLTAEIAALKKKNTTLKGQVTKARKKASVRP